MSGQNQRARKAGLINRLLEVRSEILRQACNFDHQMCMEPFVGEWSIMELLAHLAGWDLSNLEAAQAILAERLPAFYAHQGPDWREYNRLLVARHRRDDLDQMLDAVRETHQSLLEFLSTVPASEFFVDRGLRFRGYKVILSRLLQSEYDDECRHLEQITQFLAEKSSNPL